MEAKNWWASKTFWINLIAIAAIIAQGQIDFVLDAEDQVAILGVVNIVLRFITKKPLTS